MKTSELIGPALDWAVAKCEGESLDILPADYPLPSMWIGQGNLNREYSTRWAQGGPIIERENIVPYKYLDTYYAGMGIHQAEENPTGSGPTPLIAAMRCYVASKLGDEVEVPEELLKT